METKGCARCRDRLPLSDFGWKNKQKGWLQAYCKECNKQANREHYQKNKKSYKDKARAYEMSKGGKACIRYNITPEALVLLTSRYDGMCWICQENPGTDVDHDHSCCPSGVSCGKCIRGMLCRDCNVAIGHMRDDVDRLSRAINYLQTTRSCSDG